MCKTEASLVAPQNVCKGRWATHGPKRFLAHDARAWVNGRLACFIEAFPNDHIKNESRRPKQNRLQTNVIPQSRPLDRRARPNQLQSKPRQSTQIEARAGTNSLSTAQTESQENEATSQGNVASNTAAKTHRHPRPQPKTLAKIAPLTHSKPLRNHIKPSEQRKPISLIHNNESNPESASHPNRQEEYQCDALSPLFSDLRDPTTAWP